jgi:hypothetical protein
VPALIVEDQKLDTDALDRVLGRLRLHLKLHFGYFLEERRLWHTDGSGRTAPWRVDVGTSEQTSQFVTAPAHGAVRPAVCMKVERRHFRP